MASNADEVDVPVGSVALVDTHVAALFFMDPPGRDALGECDEDTVFFSEEARTFERLRGKVLANHTELRFRAGFDEVFAQQGISGIRLGAAYGDEPMTWSEALYETTEFALPLDGSRPDGEQRWSFTYKQVDPTTRDDPDACTSGMGSGSITIRISAA